MTGGSQGIGIGIARVFSQLGDQVVICGRSQERLDNACAELNQGAEGPRVHGVAANVSDPGSCQELVAKAVELLGGVDVLCANAGIYPESSLEELTTASLEEVMATNFMGTVYMVQAALPALTKSSQGRIVVTSSITGNVTGFPGLSNYAASKAAQMGFVRSAALELAPRGITVNAVLPGSILTEGLIGLGEEAIKQMEGCIPMQRLGVPEDIGHAAAYFASPGAAFVTGQALIVDGGQVLPELPL